MRLTDEGGERRRRASQGFKTAPSSAPVCALGHLTLSPLAFGHLPLTRGVGPLWGEGFGPVQIGGNSAFCGTFGYIYWELWRSAPVGRRAAQCAAPTAGFGQKRRAHNVRPYKRGCGKLPPHPPQWEACGGWAEIWSNFLLCHFLRYFFQKFRESRGKHKNFLKTGCVHPGIFLHLQIRFLSNFVL